MDQSNEKIFLIIGLIIASLITIIFSVYIIIFHYYDIFPQSDDYPQWEVPSGRMPSPDSYDTSPNIDLAPGEYELPATNMLSPNN